MRKKLSLMTPALAAVLLASAVAQDSIPASQALQAAGEGRIVIHYHRFDGNYDTPGLWTWDQRKQREPESGEVLAAGRTDFGVYFILDPSDYGDDDGPEDRIGFIPRLRRDWNFKDGTDRAWAPEMGREIWLIGNDPNIYTERPDTSPRIATAFIDAPSRLTLTVSHPLAVASVQSQAFVVTTAEGLSIPIKSARPLAARGGTTMAVEVETAQTLDPIGASYTVAGSEELGLRGAVAKARRVLDDPIRFFTTDPMGATYTTSATTFRLFSPSTTDVRLVLYNNVTGNEGRTEVPMIRRDDGVWETVVTGDLEGRHYRYLVTSHRYGTQEINDPNATNTTGVDGHARITNLRALDPPEFRPIQRPEYGTAPTDAIIYQLHIRDFTIHPTANITPSLRGKYLGLAVDGTSLAGDPTISTGLAHLKEMGVTHVQIQPFHDFDNDERNPDYNWGYMTAFFNSPEGMYATEFRTSARIAEVKQMIHALKQAGIGVILDVVYNHTGVQNTHEISAPGYFLRMRDDGSFWNGSGTGNELRSEAPMARRFIIDSLKLWMNEYGVDGFRFDLVGLIDLETIRQLKKELEADYPGVILYGEPWAATGPEGSGLDRLTYKDVIRGTGFGAFNDHFRDNIKGSPDGNDPGYIVDGRRRDGVVTGILGSINDWAANPIESINYADVHDNLILYDKLKYSAPNATPEERARMQKLSGGILAVSQGIMLIHSGVEFLRSKQGNHNSYNAGDEINAVRWDLKKQNHEVFEFYKGVVAIRRQHPLFRLRTAEEVRQRVQILSEVPAPEAIAFAVSGDGLEGETWQRAVVLINPTNRPLTFSDFGAETYTIYAHDGVANPAGMGHASGEVDVPARSITILGSSDK
jgi:pullulanase